MEDRFEFVFQGTEAQFRLFSEVVYRKVPESGIILDYVDDIGFNCSMRNDCKQAFMVGMIVSACYASFGHLENTEFATKR